MINSKIKICTGCDGEFPATTEFFHVKNSYLSGLNSQCKVCVAKRTKRYRKINRKIILVKKKVYYNDNKKKVSVTYRLWRKNNKDKCSGYVKNHNFLKRTNGIGFGDEQWKALLKTHNYRCAYCGILGKDTKQKYLTQDHVIPIDKGGEHSPENIVPACLSCNCKKGNKLNWLTPKMFDEKKEAV
ncbi:HNH endonuclease [Candidatus Pacearchaeota archaeon]|nr:HNH endonuclease [Candidatus Pacearchaeota archaeon]